MNKILKFHLHRLPLLIVLLSVEIVSLIDTCIGSLYYKLQLLLILSDSTAGTGKYKLY